MILDREYRGLTVRNQAEADDLLDDFMLYRGKLWVSCEPMQERIEWPLCEPKASPDEDTPFGWEECGCGCGWWVGLSHRNKPCIRRLAGIIVGHDNRRGALGTDTTDHILDTVGQCHAAGVRVFVKQLWSGGRLLRASHPAEYAMYPDWARNNVLPWQEEADA